MKLTVVDFETKGILPRPAYPPEPVGVSIWVYGKEPEYEAWGHPTANGLYVLRRGRVLKVAPPDPERAASKLKSLWRRGNLLFHNAKFDMEVALESFGLPVLPWDRFGDTMFRLFIKDPHAASLSLKPSAERYLGVRPTEQDELREWLVNHKIIPKDASDETFGANMWRAPGDVNAKYSIGDVVRTRGLDECEKLQFDRKECQAYERELRVLPIILKNERGGLRLDTDRLEQDLLLSEMTLEWVEGWLRKRLRAPHLNFDAARDVGNALHKTKIVTNWVWTKGGKSHPPQRSVAKDNLGPERFNDPLVASALGYRSRLHTVLANSMRPWLEQAGPGNRIYTQINQVRHHEASGGGARTGRFSASRLLKLSKGFLNRGDGYAPPSILQLPDLPLVRQYILPERGHVWNKRDVRQEEFRVMAHYEDGPLAQSFRDDPFFDVHDGCRGYIRSLGMAELAEVDRVIIKNFTHGIAYGEGADRLAVKSRMDRTLAHKLKALIWQALPGVAALNEELKRMGRAGEPIRTWGGRLYYCELPSYSKKLGRDMTWEYKLLNYLAQGSSADLLKEALIRYEEVRHSEARFLLCIHDEDNICAPPKLVASEDRKLAAAIEDMPGWDVPMPTDREVGEVDGSWGSLTKCCPKCSRPISENFKAHVADCKITRRAA